MGGHYGSVQIRSEDRERAKAIAEQIAREKQIHVLIAPPVNGWIALFPEGNGQDESVGRAVAEQSETDVLHLLVHDDDIFAYWLYRDRRLIDSYWSSPGYFGEENRDKEEAMAGNPEAFRPLIGDDVARLRELLNRDTPMTFEYERLDRFGKLLKITNAVNAFEYLKEGEPGLAGLPTRHRLVQPVQPAVGRPQPAHPRNPPHLASIVSDASARRIAFTAGKQVSVWDLDPNGWASVCDVPECDHAVGVALSPDGTLLAHSSRKEIVITRIDSGETVLRWATGGTPQCLAFHPSNQWLAVSGNTLGLLALGEAEPWRDLYVGGKWNPQAASAAIFQAKLGGMDLGTMEKEFEKRKKSTIDTTIATLLKAQGRSKTPLVSAEQVETMKREMEAEFEKMKSRIRDMREGNLPPTPPQAREQIRCVGFSRDGRWFWCGTSVALRVYEWSTIPRTSAADTPPAKWTFQLPNSPSFQGGNQVYAIVEEPNSPAIAFGGGTGILYRLDLLTGETRELIKMGENTFIAHLAMSADGTALGAATYNTPSVAAREQRQNWTIWSYPKLIGPFMRVEN